MSLGNCTWYTISKKKKNTQ